MNPTWKWHQSWSQMPPPLHLAVTQLQYLKGAYALIPGICEYVTLPDKGVFADTVEVMDLEVTAIILDYSGRLDLITQAFKSSELFSSWRQKNVAEEDHRIWSTGIILLPVVGFKDDENCDQGSGSWDSRRLTATRNTVTSILQRKGTELCQGAEWAWKYILSRASAEELRLADTLILAWRPRRRETRRRWSYPQNCDVIHFLSL